MSENIDIVRKQLEHVPLIDWETAGRQILEDNDAFHNEYELAYKMMVRAKAPGDDTYWNSITSDIFFLTVNLVLLMKRNVGLYDEYVGFVLDVAEEIGNEA